LNKAKKAIIIIFLVGLIITVPLILIFFPYEEEGDDNHEKIVLNIYPMGIRLTTIDNLNDSIVITWYSEINYNFPKVKYSIEPDLSNAIEIKANCTQIDSYYVYTVKLIHLLPNKTYYYQVGLDKSNGKSINREIMNFKTLCNYDNGNFSFLVYGDTQKQRLIISMLTKKMIDYFADTFEFTIHTGDITHFGDEQTEWNNFFMDTEHLNAYKTGFYIEGNHEEGLDTLMYQNLPLPYKEEYHYLNFSYGGVGFIFLNSNDYTRDYTTQTEWLNQTLLCFSKQNMFNFAFLHHPLLHDTSYTYHRENWRPLFEKYNVSVVFCGHNHHYERSLPIINCSSNPIEYDNSEYFNYTDITDPIYIVSGGGGGLLDPTYNDDFIARNAEAYNFLIVKLTDEIDKKIVTIETWVMLEHQDNIFKFDEITITKSK